MLEHSTMRGHRIPVLGATPLASSATLPGGKPLYRTWHSARVGRCLPHATSVRVRCYATSVLDAAYRGRRTIPQGRVEGPGPTEAFRMPRSPLHLVAAYPISVQSYGVARYSQYRRERGQYGITGEYA
eukprot:2063889-Rhodomonas_salina.1